MSPIPLRFIRGCVVGLFCMVAVPAMAESVTHSDSFSNLRTDFRLLSASNPNSLTIPKFNDQGGRLELLGVEVTVSNTIRTTVTIPTPPRNATITVTVGSVGKPTTTRVSTRSVTVPPSISSWSPPSPRSWPPTSFARGLWRLSRRPGIPTRRLWFATIRTRLHSRYSPAWAISSSRRPAKPNRVTRARRATARRSSRRPPTLRSGSATTSRPAPCLSPQPWDSSDLALSL